LFHLRPEGERGWGDEGYHEARPRYFVVIPRDGGFHHYWVSGGTHPLEAGGMPFQLISENSKRVFAEFVEQIGAFVIERHSFVDDYLS
jgi:hypothetical protein